MHSQSKRGECILTQPPALFYLYYLITYTTMSKQSLNSGTHPYLKGYSEWSKDPFWRNNPYHSKKSVAYFENWLKEMKEKETRLIRLEK